MNSIYANSMTVKRDVQQMSTMLGYAAESRLEGKGRRYVNLSEQSNRIGYTANKTHTSFHTLIARIDALVQAANAFETTKRSDMATLEYRFSQLVTNYENKNRNFFEKLIAKLVNRHYGTAATIQKIRQGFEEYRAEGRQFIYDDACKLREVNFDEQIKAEHTSIGELKTEPRDYGKDPLTARPLTYAKYKHVNKACRETLEEQDHPIDTPENVRETQQLSSQALRVNHFEPLQNHAHLNGLSIARAFEKQLVKYFNLNCTKEHMAYNFIKDQFYELLEATATQVEYGYAPHSAVENFYWYLQTALNAKNRETLRLDQTTFQTLVAVRATGATVKRSALSLDRESPVVKKLLAECSQGSWKAGEKRLLSYKNIASQLSDRVQMTLDTLMQDPTFQAVLTKYFNQIAN